MLLRCMVFALAMVLLPALAFAQVTAAEIQKTSSWGAIKSLYRGSSSDSTTSNWAGRIERSGPESAALAGAVYLAWPFSSPKNEWSGWGGDRTGGGTIPNYCGDRRTSINSHSYGDYYARDLSRYDGRQEYHPVYASTGGYVLLAGLDGCYGYSVVIWDPTRNIEVRYSHLWSVNSFVGANMSIRQGALIGWVGGTGCNGTRNFTPHVHMVVYRNLPYPKVGNICSGYAGTYYACPFYFF